MEKVSTGNGTYQEYDEDYKGIYFSIDKQINKLNKNKHKIRLVQDNKFLSLQDFYSYWRIHFKTYQERRDYIKSLYKNLELKIHELLVKLEDDEENFEGEDYNGLEWEKSIHQTAFEYLKYKGEFDAIHILEKSSLNLSESYDKWLDGDRTLTGWHLYIKVPMNLKEQLNEIISEEIKESYDESLGSDDYLRDIHVEIKKITEADDYSFYPNGEYLEIGPKYDYDVVLSFAGEDRKYIEKVANQLLYKSVKVFYDNFETVDNWGKDLYTHFDEIYRKKAKYCVIFISKNYANKVWTNHERRSAQARFFKEQEEYILPVRFDETEIPGIIPTIGYINGNKVSEEELAEMIVKKIGSFNK